METIYTTERGKYYKLSLENDTELIKTPYDINPTWKDRTDILDTLFDYLLLSENHLDWFTEEEKLEISNNGYDLNLENYLRVECPYLPFEHFIYLPDNWII